MKCDIGRGVLIEYDDAPPEGKGYRILITFDMTSH